MYMSYLTLNITVTEYYRYENLGYLKCKIILCDNDNDNDNEIDLF